MGRKWWLGHAGKFPKVAATEDHMEFVTGGAGGGDMFGSNNLSDVEDPDEARDNLNAEELGAAAAVLTLLRDGVAGPGDTLLKLYNLIIAAFQEVTVANIAARDAYNVPTLPFHIFVTNDGDGNWALYKATTTGVGASFIKISDPDLLNAVMSALAIKTAYESNADTNAFTNALLAKLNGIAAGAQKNSDILKAEIEAVLTGIISTHSHAGGGGWDVDITSTANAVANNTQNTDHAELQFPVVAGELWYVELYVSQSGNNTTGDFALNLVTTGTWPVAQASSEGVHYGGTGTLTNRLPTAAASTTNMIASPGLTTGNGDGNEWPITMFFRFRALTTGTVKVQHGVVALGAGRTATIHKGARLLARKMRAL